MGEQEIRENLGNEDLRVFMRALLEDVRALERMIHEGMIEDDVRRIGAEQEMFLVDKNMRPANRALSILERLHEPQSFTTELGLFNLEFNLKPHVLEGTCLSDMERELDEGLAKVRSAAAQESTKIVLTGILPTLEKRDLGLESMTPIPRFYQLNQVMRELRGGEFRTYIKGLDELQTTHDNVMLEACNTSFQVHFQVAPHEFAKLYNLAQVVTAPVLAAAVNSPVLLRHRLWQETRVALFQQSLDTRSHAHTMRGGRMRVSFGDEWVRESVMEIFREDVARFRVLISAELEESPLELLDQGKVPTLKALRLHNGTVYRWNRPCYGISGGKPHLRIENRVLPAGPSVVDEVANAAFFFGLMCGLGDQHDDVTTLMDFDDARANFIAAARYGLNARLRWLGGRPRNADEVILDLMPVARQGLADRKVPAADIDRYLGILEERVRADRTGSNWVLDSLDAMGGRHLSDERFRAITKTMVEEQEGGKPIHEWELAQSGSMLQVRDSYRTVGQIMATDLFTVHPEDLVDLAASVMDWEHLRHVPVEDTEGRLVGLITHRHLLRMVSKGISEKSKPIAVREIMRAAPVTCSPETQTIEAISLMRSNKVGCLPVVSDGRLVGIVTETDFIDVAKGLLDQWLREE